MMRETINGKRVAFYGSSDAEVEKKRDAYIKAGEDGHTFKYYLDIWWEKKEPALSPNSVGNFKTAMYRVQDAFGDKLIKDIRPQDLHSFLCRLAAKDYSARVVNMSKTVLRQTYDEAFIDGAVDRNPVNDIPAVKCKPAGVREAATDEDCDKLEKHKLDSNYTRMLYFCLYTGCRRGEAMGLQWKHVDIAKRSVTIVQSVAYGKQSPTIKQPKTSAGIRTVALLDNVIPVLPQQGPPEQFVFFPEGLPQMRTFERAIRKTYDDIGVQFTCHMLRHKYTSMLYSYGLQPKDMQQLLGHSDIKTTMDIYTHIERQHAANVTEGLNAFVQERIKK